MSENPRRKNGLHQPKGANSFGARENSTKAKIYTSFEIIYEIHNRYISLLKLHSKASLSNDDTEHCECLHQLLTAGLHDVPRSIVLVLQFVLSRMIDTEVGDPLADYRKVLEQRTLHRKLAVWSLSFAVLDWAFEIAFRFSGRILVFLGC